MNMSKGWRNYMKIEEYSCIFSFAEERYFEKGLAETVPVYFLAERSV